MTRQCTRSKCKMKYSIPTIPFSSDPSTTLQFACYWTGSLSMSYSIIIPAVRTQGIHAMKEVDEINFSIICDYPTRKLRISVLIPTTATSTRHKYLAQFQNTFREHVSTPSRTNATHSDTTRNWLAYFTRNHAPIMTMYSCNFHLHLHVNATVSNPNV